MTPLLPQPRGGKAAAETISPPGDGELLLADQEIPERERVRERERERGRGTSLISRGGGGQTDVRTVVHTRLWTTFRRSVNSPQICKQKLL
jgi:hypothetical protein